MSILSKDIVLQFPDLTVITASAGAGKTYTLARRYVQFLLSNKIRGNDLRNILAITFTNLASKEMKERIISLLKQAALNDRILLTELLGLVALSEDEIALRASRMVEEIIHNYSDFHVRTIDSFMSTVFKASALEFGYQPNVDITFDAEALVRQTFDAFSRDLKEGSAEANFIDELITLIEEQERFNASYLWNPFAKIITEVRELHKQFGRYASEPVSSDSGETRRILRKKIIEVAQTVRRKFDESGLPLYTHFSNDINKLTAGDILPVVGKVQWEKFFVKFDKEQEAKYERMKKDLFKSVNQLQKLLDEFAAAYAEGYYEPFIRAVRMVEETLQQIKRLEGSIVLDDVNRTLAGYLSDAVVPQVYLKLGETLNHFLIDEFQDTSPIQWYNLHPLIENSLSVDGSLFGDTKQSIYGFRGADWRIMKRLESDPHYFPSAHSHVVTLDRNYRSSQALVDFVKEVFTVKTKEIGYDTFAKESGLLECAQNVPTDQQGKGYVEVKFIQLTDDSDNALDEERKYIVDAIVDCVHRGYDYKDIAILTPNNADVVQISSWLNAATIPFISHSTLDVRRRKVIGELIAYLRFLDSPVDNLSFATFVLGDVFTNVLKQSTSSLHREHLQQLLFESTSQSGGYHYLTFRRKYSELWERYFETLFNRVGYMPVYDLVSEMFKNLSVFELCKNEESALIKFLECVKQFENERNNSVKDFLSYTQEESEGDEWSIDVPTNAHAVRVMTVHKSKGLGFPVVIALFKDKSRRNIGPVMVESENKLSMLKITKNLAERSEDLNKIYKQREHEIINDELNRLYVALTRAQREMYVVSLMAKEKKGKYKNDDEKNIPSMLFPQQSFGSKFQQAEKISIKPALTVLPSFLKQSAQMPVAQYEKIGLAETMRGDFVHDVLSRVEFLSDSIEQEIQSAIAFVQPKYATDFSGTDMEKTLIEFLSLNEVHTFFEPKAERKILREQDFVSGEGRLFRMDRVIVDRDSVAVVDFKTGNDEMNEKYAEQVKNYTTLLRSIYKERKISGALLYIDMKKVVTVA
ncbi:MAG: UvrD-helicase domain-containing protein [Ignavibacteriales bacterium]|nr:UvrD-helicase domain-containing protein [Ignavibacteriales bacterium]